MRSPLTNSRSIVTSKDAYQGEPRRQDCPASSTSRYHPPRGSLLQGTSWVIFLRVFTCTKTRGGPRRRIAAQIVHCKARALPRLRRRSFEKRVAKPSAGQYESVQRFIPVFRSERPLPNVTHVGRHASPYNAVCDATRIRVEPDPRSSKPKKVLAVSYWIHTQASSPA
jgi:hypothetical protein